MLVSNTSLVSLELSCLDFSPKKMGDALAQNKSLKILNIKWLGDLRRDAFKAEFDGFMNGLRRNHTLLECNFWAGDFGGNQSRQERINVVMRRNLRETGWTFTPGCIEEAAKSFFIQASGVGEQDPGFVMSKYLTAQDASVLMRLNHETYEAALAGRFEERLDATMDFELFELESVMIDLVEMQRGERKTDQIDVSDLEIESICQRDDLPELCLTLLKRYGEHPDLLAPLFRRILDTFDAEGFAIFLRRIERGSVQVKKNKPLLLHRCLDIIDAPASRFKKSDHVGPFIIDANLDLKRAPAIVRVFVEYGRLRSQEIPGPRLHRVRRKQLSLK